MSYIDFESQIADSLHARADRTVEVDRLQTAALARAKVIRRRQVTGTAVVAGLAVLATTAVTAAIATPSSPGSADSLTAPAEPGVLEVAGPTSLPGIPGVPPAAQQPAAVGTDPSALHFDLDLAALGASASDWRSGPRHEGVTVPVTEESARVDIYIGPDAGALDSARPQPGPYATLDNGETVPLYEAAEPEPTTVDGRPGTLQEVTIPAQDGPDGWDEIPEGARISDIYQFQSDRDTTVWVLRWQPAEGLHAVAQSSDQDLVYEAAAALLVDRAQQCAIPLHLSAVPEGAEWTECRTVLRHDPAGESVAWALSSMTLSRPGADPIGIYAEDPDQAVHPADADRIVPNRTVAGYPAWWSTEAPAGLFVPAFGTDGNQAAVFVDGADEQLAIWLIEHLAVAGERDRPETWPTRAVG